MTAHQSPSRKLFTRLAPLLLLHSLAEEPLMAASESTSWPDRAWLVRSLVRAVPRILKKQDAQTGRFGSKPWVCSDQNVLFPLAVAWATKDDDNPYWHDPRLLEAICRGGSALTRAQDNEGRWTFRKKDNTTWGQIYMPWTYSRWIRAYTLIKDDMPGSYVKEWRQGLIRGFKGIRATALTDRVHNIPTHHAMALYIAGMCFDSQDWRQEATRYMAKVVAAQDPDGFWSEHVGPVVGYNQVYVDALGIYYSVSRDRSVLEALRRAAVFHATFLWPDGTAVSAIDERQIYHRRRNIGNPGFSHTPAGRGYLLHQSEKMRRNGHPANADYAASMLLYGGTGKGAQLISATGKGRVVLGKNKALMQRDAPWQFCLSAYYCPVPKSRWIQDRQNFLDIYHDELGLIIGGGNTKLQPYWSTFTVGNPRLLEHRPGDTNPDFKPPVDLLWVPERATLLTAKHAPGLQLRYGKETCTVTVRVIRDRRLQLTYRTSPPKGEPVEAHLPFLKRQGGLRLANGRRIYLNHAPIEIPAEETGGSMEWHGMGVTIPAGSRLLWPALQHNPYKKDGSSPLDNARLVLVMPFSGSKLSYSVTVAYRPPPEFPGLVFHTGDLPVMSPTQTRMKPLDNLDSYFLGATKPGDTMTFEITLKKGGTYCFLTDFVTFPGYGIVQLAIDGVPIGDPVDAYAPELDSSGPIPIGRTELAEGTHTISVKVVGKNPKAKNHFISVKRFLFTAVD